MTDADLDAYLPGVPPGELRLALRGILRHAFQAAALYPVFNERGECVEGLTNERLTALELWARGQLDHLAGQ